MTARQEKHVADLQEIFCTLLENKYRKGAREHGGDLHDLSALALVDAAIEETIDQAVYLLTLREKLANGPPRT